MYSERKLLLMLNLCTLPSTISILTGKEHKQGRKTTSAHFIIAYILIFFINFSFFLDFFLENFFFGSNFFSPRILNQTAVSRPEGLGKEYKSSIYSWGILNKDQTDYHDQTASANCSNPQSKPNVPPKFKSSLRVQEGEE